MKFINMITVNLLILFLGSLGAVSAAQNSGHYQPSGKTQISKAHASEEKFTNGHPCTKEDPRGCQLPEFQ